MRRSLSTARVSDAAAALVVQLLDVTSMRVGIDGPDGRSDRRDQHEGRHALCGPDLDVDRRRQRRLRLEAHGRRLAAHRRDPGLELKAVSHTGAGIFSDITYVLRVNTRKGKAAPTGCDGTTSPPRRSSTTRPTTTSTRAATATRVSGTFEAHDNDRGLIRAHSAKKGTPGHCRHCPGLVQHDMCRPCIAHGTR